MMKMWSDFAKYCNVVLKVDGQLDHLLVVFRE